MVRVGTTSASSGALIKRNVDAFFFGAPSSGPLIIPPPSPFSDRPSSYSRMVSKPGEDDDVEEEEEEEEEETGPPPLALLSKRRGSLPTEIIDSSSMTAK